MRRLNGKKRLIVPKPRGFFALENLHGTKFQSTMENGKLGEVDVTVQTLKAEHH